MNNRKSNFELMRIVSMLMIVMWHLLDQGGFYSNCSEFTQILLDFLRLVLVVHVNSFILLSGYFQCDKRFKLSKFLKLVGLVWFYKILILIISSVLNLNELTTIDFIKSISPITYIKEYWYIATYLVLYLISPILNKIINNVDKKTLLKYIVVSFLIVSVLSTFTLEEAFNNGAGYTLYNFILLYFIGAYIKRYPSSKLINMNQSTLKLCFLFLFLSLVTINFLFYRFSFQLENFNSISKRFSAIMKTGVYYDNPLVIISTIVYFMFFSILNIKNNKLINFFAKATLGVYLIHTNLLLRNIFYSHFGCSSYMTNGLRIIMLLILNTILVFLICTLIDSVRYIIFKFISSFKIVIRIKERIKKKIYKFNFDINW